MVPNRTRKGSYSVGLATRESILSASAEMIAEVGYHAMSLRDLARKVGISHPAVVYHFPSKEAMIRMVVQRMEEELGIIEVERDENDGSLRPVRVKVEGFKDLAIRLMEIAIHPNGAQLLTLSAVVEHEAGSETHPMHEYMILRRRLLEEFGLERIESGRESGNMQFITVDTFVARNLALIWTGIKQYARMEGGKVDAMDLIAHFLATCVIHLKVTPAALVAFSAQLPEELAAVYIRVVNNVNRVLV